MKAASASRDSAPPTLNPLTPIASISAAVSEGSAALITTFKGFADGLHTDLSVNPDLENVLAGGSNRQPAA